MHRRPAIWRAAGLTGLTLVGNDGDAGASLLGEAGGDESAGVPLARDNGDANVLRVLAQRRGRPYPSPESTVVDGDAAAGLGPDHKIRRAVIGQVTGREAQTELHAYGDVGYGPGDRPGRRGRVIRQRLDSMLAWPARGHDELVAAQASQVGRRQVEAGCARHPRRSERPRQHDRDHRGVDRRGSGDLERPDFDLRGSPVTRRRGDRQVGDSVAGEVAERQVERSGAHAERVDERDQGQRGEAGCGRGGLAQPL